MRERNIFYVKREEIPCPLNSGMKASALLGQGYIRCWCYAFDTQPKEEKAEDSHVVCEFRDVFLKSYREYPAKRS